MISVQKHILKFSIVLFSFALIAGYGYFVFAAAPSGGYDAGTTLDPDCSPGDIDCTINTSSLTGGWTADPVGGPLGTGLSVTDYIVGIGTDDPQDLLHLYRDDLDMSVGMRIENQNPGTDSAAVLSLYNDLGLNGGLVSYGSNFANPMFAGSFGLAADIDATGIRIWDADETPGAGNIQFGIGDTSIMQIRDYHVNIGIVPESFLDDSNHGILNVGLTDGRNYAIFGTSTDTEWTTDEETKYIFSEDYLRMGSIDDDNWDSLNRGIRSVAIGFAAPAFGAGFGPTASGNYSLALGTGSTASGMLSTAIGSSAFATGSGSFAGTGARASGQNATAFNLGSEAGGRDSFAAGYYATAPSFRELALGSVNTLYTPVSTSSWDSADRLFTVGNGSSFGSKSDAFTILKSGLTGIGYDNFETTPNNALLQVNGSVLQTNAVGCDVVADADGVIGCAPSDEKLKDNIEDISYGLDTILSLRPVTYDFKDSTYGSGEQLGFIAQELESILPQVVTSGPNYKSVNYGLITPVLTKAIQELDIKISDIQSLADEDNSFGDTLRSWFADTTNGIGEFVATTIRGKRVETEELCVGSVCVTEEQFMQVFSGSMIPSAGGGSSSISESEPSPQEDILSESSDPGVESEVIPENSPEALPEPSPSEETSSEEENAPSNETVGDSNSSESPSSNVE